VKKKEAVTGPKKENKAGKGPAKQIRKCAVSCAVSCKDTGQKKRPGCRFSHDAKRSHTISAKY
jgi:hypothetical protein